MEIEAGEYVRTKEGIIGIFQNIDEHRRHFGERLEDTIYIINTEKNEYLRLTDNDIKTHSKNIVDLIEVGDIVYTEDAINNRYYCMYDEGYIEALKKDIADGIKLVSILTYERYEQNCYKLKEIN